MRWASAASLLVLGAVLAPVLAADAGRREAESRTLFIGLDAVPYDVVARLTAPERGEAALFRSLRGPAAVISTFPSTTSLAFGGILEPFGLAPSPGYEVRFFDRPRNRRRGGGLISYQKIPFPWRSFFDWKVHDVFTKLRQALRPRTASRRAIDRSLEAFMRSDAPVYFIYYDATDLVAHMQGPEGLEPVLRHLDGALSRLHERHPHRPFRTVLYSDHGLAGGEPLRNVRRAVRRAARQTGLRIASRLKGPRDVVFMPFGLVSSLVAYTSPGIEPEVAKALASAEGIDFCVGPSAASSWTVVGEGGGAGRIRHRIGRVGSEWSYEPLTGDPLELSAIVEAFQRHDPGRAGWFSDRRWLAATAARRYPDPLYRIARGFDLVTNRASVICSLEDGYMYGASITVLGSRISVGRLRWTHGALLRNASLGFLLSDVPSWDEPETVRFDQALEPFVPLLGFDRQPE